MRVLASPILALCQTALRVAEGDRHARVQVTRSDEVGVLGQCFNTMLDTLQASEHALREARDSLQTRVEERTAQLKTLQAIDRSILAASTPDEIAEATLRHVCQLMPCRRASITIFDHDRGEAVVRAAAEWPKVSPDASAALGVGARMPTDVLHSR